METTTIHLIFGVVQILGFTLLVYGGYKYVKARRALDKKLVLTNAYDCIAREDKIKRDNLETYVIDYTVTPDQFNDMTQAQVEKILKTQASTEVAAMIANRIAVSYDRKPYAKEATLSIRARVLFKVINELPQNDD